MKKCECPGPWISTSIEDYYQLKSQVRTWLLICTKWKESQVIFIPKDIIKKIIEVMVHNTNDNDNENTKSLHSGVSFCDRCLDITLHLRWDVTPPSHWTEGEKHNLSVYVMRKGGTKLLNEYESLLIRAILWNNHHAKSHDILIGKEEHVSNLQCSQIDRYSLNHRLTPYALNEGSYRVCVQLIGVKSSPRSLQQENILSKIFSAQFHYFWKSRHHNVYRIANHGM